MINSFRFGYLYPPSWNPWGENEGFEGWRNYPQAVGWPLVTSPMSWSYPISNYYPVFTLADTVTWQKGSHGLSFGFSAYRENDRYWNRPEPTDITLGLVTGDPALDALTNSGTYQPLPFASTTQQAQCAQPLCPADRAHQLLHGNVPVRSENRQLRSGAAPSLRSERSRQSGGIFIQDTWRLTPNLTINAGLRWDFTAASYDKQGAYHNADLASIYGPSGIGNLFKPGTLTGNMNPTLEERPSPYNNWYVTPQPSLGFACNPK